MTVDTACFAVSDFNTPYTIQCVLSPKRVEQLGHWYRTSPPDRVIDYVCSDTHSIHYSNMFLFGYDRLSNYVSDGRCLQPSTCIEIVQQILMGLVETQMVSHGNVSMGNILVRSDDRGGGLDVRLGVFGETNEGDMIALSVILIKLWNASNGEVVFIHPLLKSML